MRRLAPDPRQAVLHPAESGPAPSAASLSRGDLPIGVVEMARWLIGKTLVHERGGLTSGRIVETEAYPVGDSSGHAFRGMTSRNRSMFLGPGHAYVYFIYGNWFSLNVSAEPEGTGAGVLLRALEPLDGVPLMERRRGCKIVHDLARGPGRLATAMAIDRRQDGVDLFAEGPLRLAAAARPVGEIATSVRIGISREADRPLRFYERGSPFVSGRKGLNV